MFFVLQMEVNTLVIHESSGIEYQPPRTLAKALARSSPVILVEQSIRCSPFSSFSLPARTRRGDKLFQYHPLHLPQRYGLSLLTAPINRWLWKREMLRLLDGEPPAMVVFDRPVQHDRVKLLQESLSVYYAHCDYTVDIVGNRIPALVEQEKRMLARVDIALAASQYLVERVQSLGAKHVIHFPCAYTSEHFDGQRTYSEPACLAGLARPRLLFCGYISGRVDFIGLERLARTRPDWQLLFAGKVSSGLKDELEYSGRDRKLWQRLSALPNVHYLGTFSLAEVPAIMAHCDVGLVPYCLSAFTLSSSPIKAFEYTAMGLPVVSTPVAETVGLGENIFVVEEAGDYADAVTRALTAASDKTRVLNAMKKVMEHTVEARALQLMSLHITGSKYSKISHGQFY